MPRKTRKEKKLALERKQKEIVAYSNTNYKVTIPSEVTHHALKPDPTAHIKNNPEQKIDNSLRKYFLVDLKKSLIIVTSIIALEICLYFASINHYL